MSSPELFGVPIYFMLERPAGAAIGLLVAALDWASNVASRLGHGALIVAAYSIRLQWYVDQAME